MNQPFKLYRLQQIDSQLDWTRARLEEIDVILANKSELQKAQQRHEKTNLELSTAQKELRQAEENVNQQQLKIEHTESTLYSGKVRNPKELQDMQNELAAHNRYLSVLEERQLKAMFTEEEAAANNQATFEQLELVQEKSAQQRETLNKEKEGLLVDVSRLEDERLAAANGIPEPDMKLYNTLRLQRRGIAVAKVSDETCSACGTTLSSTLLDSARKPNQLNLCETCGRILYVG